MAHAGQTGPALGHPASAGPKPTGLSQTESVQSKRDLTSWWKTFKRGNAKQDERASQGIFGVPLQQSIRYANVAISLFNEEGQSYIYGYVPIVVAKCGVFLKEKATDIEGIFRLSGSEKRIKELKLAFDSPDRYGKGLDWTGYTVHDAANILRRYFNQLPEPIIPLDFYERFRVPLRNHQAQAVGAMESQGPELGSFDADRAIRAYQALITELPPLNRQLLLYILDLLAVFASKSDLNKMTTANLAAIFQPGLLSHPQHDMAPQEYRLSQDVLIFLIENQDSFLIGMHGTAADEKTVQEVQSGVQSPAPGTPTTPGRSRTNIGRSASNASAGADSVRLWGGLRRNLSVSSRGSRKSNGGHNTASPVLGSPTTLGSGVYRSNTVPSKRSAAASPRFAREKSSDPTTPSPSSQTPVGTPGQERPTQQLSQAASGDILGLTPIAPPGITSASSSETAMPLAAPVSDSSSAGLFPREYSTPKETATSLAPPNATHKDGSSERTASGTPSGNSRALLEIFKVSPEGESKDGRKPKKLQKKQRTGSALSSTQSSAQDLQSSGNGTQVLARSPISPTFPSEGSRGLGGEEGEEKSQYSTPQLTPREAGFPQRMPTDSTLKPNVSPPHSYRSKTSFTDTSDADYADDGVAQSEKRERKKRWRFSQSSKQRNSEQNTPTGPSTNRLGNHVDQSRSTLGSTAGSNSVGASRSLQTSQELPSQGTELGSSPPDNVMSDSEEKKKGPMSWIRGKLAERKEKDAEKRAQTPPRNRERSGSRHSSSLTADMSVRGKSMDVSRQQSEVLTEEPVREQEQEQTVTS